MNKIWTVRPHTGEDAQQLGQHLNLNQAVAQILAQRGLTSSEEAAAFLRPSLLNIASPFCFVDMPKTVARLAEARASQEKVLVYGDYDVDGVTSTALVYKVLIDLGFQAVAYIPHRQEEGYGLHAESITKAAQADVRIIITVDCGITAQAEVELANELGMDVIITDHHEAPSVLPAAYAILNPKVKGSGYPFRDLAGVGVAFKLVQALVQKLGHGSDLNEVGIHSEIELLDLVALGTIADVVPLTGENRVLVHYGLKQMEQTLHPGLQALVEECGLKGQTLSAGQVAFMLAPRINAAGRMDSARVGLELLLTQDAERAASLARQLSRENALRQETERQILAEAISRIESAPLPRVIVLSAPDWHHGVIGIVASRLVERYYRPVFLMAEDGEESKGSARGIPGYHVLEHLNTQATLLTKFGGHRQAAGFSLPTRQIDALRQGLNEQAESLAEDIFDEVLRLDGLIDLVEVSPELQQELEQLAPFGFGNAGPVLGAREVAVSSVAKVGKDNSHLKLKLGADGELEGMAFRQGERWNELVDCPKVDIAFSVEKNIFQGQEKLVLICKDIQAAANWRQGDRQKMTGITAAGESAKWLDWRSWDRQRWIKQALAEACLYPPHPELGLADRILVWDATGSNAQLSTLAEFQEKPGHSGLEQETLRTPKTGEWLLGIMVGIPKSWRDFNKGIGHFQELGVPKIALAEVHVPEEKLRQATGFLMRDELIGIYRELQEQARKSNPFLKPLPDNTSRQALKIFEELGLIRCLGGTEVAALELLPVGQKMDLDSSLYYTISKRGWQELQELRMYISEFPIDQLTTRHCEERRQIR